MESDGPDISFEDGYYYEIQQHTKEETVLEVNTMLKESTALSGVDLTNSLKYATYPLKYWKNHQYNFPALVEMARKYLAVNSTSVISERLFGEAKRITNTGSTNMLPENVKINALMNCWSS